MDNLTALFALAFFAATLLPGGSEAGLLAWVPIIGDPITVAAGVMRMGFGRFLLLVSISKISRYVLLLGLFNLVA